MCGRGRVRKVVRGRTRTQPCVYCCGRRHVRFRSRRCAVNVLSERRLSLSILPRDAMPARYKLWPYVRLSVYLFVTSLQVGVLIIETAERIELVLGMGNSFKLSYTVF